jgi:alkylation response protein AidB-like acyl-CoA dehydrogenase
MISHTFIFTDEQLELQATVRGFLADKSAEDAVRRLMATPSGYDPDVWKQMSDQLGLQGMAVPEEYEGAGFGYVELGIVFEEMGRALLCAPYLATVALAAETLMRCGDEAVKKDLLPALAAGGLIGTLAVLEQARPPNSVASAMLTSLPGQAEHRLGEDVALYFGRACVDRPGPGVQVAARAGRSGLRRHRAVTGWLHHHDRLS